MEYVGIDVHKQSSYDCILTEEGEVIEEMVRTEADRFAAVLGTRSRGRVVLEASTERVSLPASPDPTALRRFLRRFALRGLPKLRRLHDRWLAQLCQRPQPLTRVLLDLDSTVLTLYGQQEQARIGYNPRKRGRPSYHPLLCFEGQAKDYWHGELRPGDAHQPRSIVSTGSEFDRIHAGFRFNWNRDNLNLPQRREKRGGTSWGGAECC